MAIRFTATWQADTGTGLLTADVTSVPPSSFGAPTDRVTVSLRPAGGAERVLQSDEVVVTATLITIRPRGGLAPGDYTVTVTVVRALGGTDSGTALMRVAGPVLPPVDPPPVEPPPVLSSNGPFRAVVAVGRGGARTWTLLAPGRNQVPAGAQHPPLTVALGVTVNPTTRKVDSAFVDIRLGTGGDRAQSDDMDVSVYFSLERDLLRATPNEPPPSAGIEYASLGYRTPQRGVMPESWRVDAVLREREREITVTLNTTAAPQGLTVHGGKFNAQPEARPVRLPAGLAIAAATIWAPPDPREGSARLGKRILGSGTISLPQQTSVSLSGVVLFVSTPRDEQTIVTYTNPGAPIDVMPAAFEQRGDSDQDFTSVSAHVRRLPGGLTATRTENGRTTYVLAGLGRIESITEGRAVIRAVPAAGERPRQQSARFEVTGLPLPLAVWTERAGGVLTLEYDAGTQVLPRAEFRVLQRDTGANPEPPVHYGALAVGLPPRLRVQSGTDLLVIEPRGATGDPAQIPDAGGFVRTPVSDADLDVAPNLEELTVALADHKEVRGRAVGLLSLRYNLNRAVNPEDGPYKQLVVRFAAPQVLNVRYARDGNVARAVVERVPTSVEAQFLTVASQPGARPRVRGALVRWRLPERIAAVRITELRIGDPTRTAIASGTGAIRMLPRELRLAMALRDEDLYLDYQSNERLGVIEATRLSVLVEGHTRPTELFALAEDLPHGLTATTGTARYRLYTHDGVFRFEERDSDASGEPSPIRRLDMRAGTTGVPQGAPSAGRVHADLVALRAQVRLDGLRVLDYAGPEATGGEHQVIYDATDRVDLDLDLRLPATTIRAATATLPAHVELRGDFARRLVYDASARIEGRLTVVVDTVETGPLNPRGFVSRWVERAARIEAVGLSDHVDVRFTPPRPARPRAPREDDMRPRPPRSPHEVPRDLSVDDLRDLGTSDPRLAFEYHANHVITSLVAAYSSALRTAGAGLDRAPARWTVDVRSLPRDIRFDYDGVAWFRYVASETLPDVEVTGEKVSAGPYAFLWAVADGVPPEARGALSSEPFEIHFDLPPHSNALGHAWVGLSDERLISPYPRQTHRRGVPRRRRNEEHAIWVDADLGVREEQVVASAAGLRNASVRLLSEDLAGGATTRLLIDYTGDRDGRAAEVWLAYPVLDEEGVTRVSEDSIHVVAAAVAASIDLDLVVGRRIGVAVTQSSPLRDLRVTATKTAPGGGVTLRDVRLTSSSVPRHLDFAFDFSDDRHTWVSHEADETVPVRVSVTSAEGLAAPSNFHAIEFRSHGLPRRVTASLDSWTDVTLQGQAAVFTGLDKTEAVIAVEQDALSASLLLSRAGVTSAPAEPNHVLVVTRSDGVPEEIRCAVVGLTQARVVRHEVPPNPRSEPPGVDPRVVPTPARPSALEARIERLPDGATALVDVKKRRHDTEGLRPSARVLLRAGVPATVSLTLKRGLDLPPRYRGVAAPAVVLDSLIHLRLATPLISPVTVDADGQPSAPSATRVAEIQVESEQFTTEADPPPGRWKGWGGLTAGVAAIPTSLEIATVRPDGDPGEGADDWRRVPLRESTGEADLPREFDRIGTLVRTDGPVDLLQIKLVDYKRDFSPPDDSSYWTRTTLPFLRLTTDGSAGPFSFNLWRGETRVRENAPPHPALGPFVSSNARVSLRAQNMQANIPRDVPVDWVAEPGFERAGRFQLQRFNGAFWIRDAGPRTEAHPIGANGCWWVDPQTYSPIQPNPSFGTHWGGTIPATLGSLLVPGLGLLYWVITYGGISSAMPCYPLSGLNEPEV